MSTSDNSSDSRSAATVTGTSDIGFGVDIGGSGIKGARVDLETG